MMINNSSSSWPFCTIITCGQGSVLINLSYVFESNYFTAVLPHTCISLHCDYIDYWILSFFIRDVLYQKFLIIFRISRISSILNSVQLNGFYIFGFINVGMKMLVLRISSTTSWMSTLWPISPVQSRSAMILPREATSRRLRTPLIRGWSAYTWTVRLISFSPESSYRWML